MPGGLEIARGGFSPAFIQRPVHAPDPLALTRSSFLQYRTCDLNIVDQPSIHNDHKVTLFLTQTQHKQLWNVPPCRLRSTDHRVYQVRGLDSGLGIYQRKSWNNEYGGHILEIEDELPQDATNPVGLWLGHSFASRAVELKGPKLPSHKNGKSFRTEGTKSRNANALIQS